MDIQGYTAQFLAWARDFSLSHIAQLPIQWVRVAVSSGVKQPGWEADPSPSSSPKFKNEWIYAALPHMSLWLEHEQLYINVTLYVSNNDDKLVMVYTVHKIPCIFLYSVLFIQVTN
jgi:hypothetical protein